MHTFAIYHANTYYKNLHRAVIVYEYRYTRMLYINIIILWIQSLGSWKD